MCSLQVENTLPEPMPDYKRFFHTLVLQLQHPESAGTAFQTGDDFADCQRDRFGKGRRHHP